MACYDLGHQNVVKKDLVASDGRRRLMSLVSIGYE